MTKAGAIPVVIPVVVIGARGRLGAFACELLRSRAEFDVRGQFASGDSWPQAVRALAPCVALEATRAGLGFEHGLALLEAGARPVIGTSGVSPEQNRELDRRARELGLGGLVVPNFSVGALLLQRACEEAARHFADAEIVELHHERKRDAPSGTALETARRIAAARRDRQQGAGASADAAARGEVHDGVRIHSVRLPGLYAHQEVLFGAAGETLTLRHDMHGPQAFGPGILAALRYAWTAEGIGRGIELAL
jgi:4-hydroxy-tetrahydrodipicolinate reductase